jgi:hypothetical protein
MNLLTRVCHAASVTTRDNHSGPGTARVLNVHAPDGGFADFLRRISD